MEKENNNNTEFQPNEGDVVYFFYDQAGKQKFAVNLEPLDSHRYKPNFNGVIVTSQHTDSIYPGDYLLEEGTLPQTSKVICDQIVSLPKNQIIKISSMVSDGDLKEIRKKAARGIGINKTTLE